MSYNNAVTYNVGYRLVTAILKEGHATLQPSAKYIILGVTCDGCKIELNSDEKRDLSVELWNSYGF